MKRNRSSLNKLRLLLNKLPGLIFPLHFHRGRFNRRVKKFVWTVALQRWFLNKFIDLVFRELPLLRPRSYSCFQLQSYPGFFSTLHFLEVVLLWLIYQCPRKKIQFDILLDLHNVWTFQYVSAFPMPKWNWDSELVARCWKTVTNLVGWPVENWSELVTCSFNFWGDPVWRLAES